MAIIKCRTEHRRNKERNDAMIQGTQRHNDSGNATTQWFKERNDAMIQGTQRRNDSGNATTQWFKERNDAMIQGTQRRNDSRNATTRRFKGRNDASEDGLRHKFSELVNGIGIARYIAGACNRETANRRLINLLCLTIQENNHRMINLYEPRKRWALSIITQVPACSLLSKWQVLWTSHKFKWVFISQHLAWAAIKY